MNVASRHLNTAIIVLACAFLFVVISLVAVFSGTVSPDNAIVSTPTLVQVAPTDSSQYQSVLSFDPDQEFSDQERMEITQKVIEPMLLYYSTMEAGSPVAITIRTNPDETDTENPYTGEVGFDSGLDVSFTIERVDGQLAWWLPVCSDDICQFTDEFTLAYPQIVAFF